MHAMIALAGLSILADPAMAQDAGEPAVGERWAYVDMLDGATGWDLNRLARDEEADAFQVVRFVHYDAANTSQPIAFHWVFHEIRVDCDDNTFRLLRGDYYDGDRALVANMLPEDIVYPIREQTTEWLLKVSLCDGVAIIDQRESTVLDEMMTEVEAFAAQ